MDTAVRLTPDQHRVSSDADAFERLLTSLSFGGVAPEGNVETDQDGQFVHYTAYCDPMESKPSIIVSHHLPTGRYDVYRNGKDHGPFSSFEDVLKLFRSTATLVVVVDQD